MGLFKRRVQSPVERLMAAAGLPTAGGEIPVSDIAMDVVRRGQGRIRATLAVVEELLAEDGPGPRVALDLLEDVQNAASHGADGLLTTGELLPLRGPRTAQAWDELDRFWAAVVAWCDETGVELEPSEPLRAIVNPALRSIVWPANRHLADGRRVGLPEVLRYEMAGGAPIPALGPHPSP